MKLLLAAGLLITTLLTTACQTSDAQLADAGRSQAYITGFHDGRHSGMKEAGNNFEHYIRDTERFKTDAEYRDGWLAGEVEGKRIQEQAVAIGNAAAGAYSTHEIDKAIDKNDPDNIAKDPLKGVDTDSLKVLEQQQ